MILNASASLRIQLSIVTQDQMWLSFGAADTGRLVGRNS